jgi:hypothetical protein
VIAAGSRGVNALGDAAKTLGTDAAKAIDATGKWLDEAGAGLGLRGPHLAPAGASGVPARLHDVPGAGTIHEARRLETPRATARTHEEAGGHTLERHGTAKESALVDRLAKNPDFDAASGFYNERAVNTAQAIFVRKTRHEIDAWLHNTKEPKFTATIDCERNVGKVLQRGNKAPEDTSIVRGVLLRKKSAIGGWYFHTTFLLPRK